MRIIKRILLIIIIREMFFILSLFQEIRLQKLLKKRIQKLRTVRTRPLTNEGQWRKRTRHSRRRNYAGDAIKPILLHLIPLPHAASILLSLSVAAMTTRKGTLPPVWISLNMHMRRYLCGFSRIIVCLSLC